MKWVLLICCIVFTGCVSIDYNGKTGQLSYNRFGSQVIDNLAFEKSGDDLKLSLDKIDAKESELTALLSELLSKINYDITKDLSVPVTE